MRTAMLIVVSMAHLISRLTGGYAMKYHQYNLREITKQRLMFFHALLAFVLAFGITNNYLNEFQFFIDRFASSVFWIIGTAFILLIVLLITIGSGITLLASRWR
jgi:hypothetical protein